MTKVCNTRDLEKPEYRELAQEYMTLANDGSRDWRANNHCFRAFEYTHSYRSLQLDTAKRMCDVGSENSIFTIWIKKRHPELEIICVDPHLDGRLQNRAALHDVDLKVDGGVFRPELGTFDRIACISVLEHVRSDDDVALVKQMAAQLEPQGILAITVDYGPEDIPWPRRTENVMGCGRMYGPQQVMDRIITPSGLEVVSDGPVDWTFRPLDNTLDWVDPLYVRYTSVVIILRKP